MLTDKEMDEIKGMKGHELKAAAKIIWYQLNAPIFVGDRKSRLAVWDVLMAENEGRVAPQRMPVLKSAIRARVEAGA